MNKYLAELQNALIQLKPAEQSEVLDYYQEYLQEAQITTYQACVDELGTPRALARKTLADYSIRLNDEFVDQQNNRANRQQQAKSNIRMSWLIILALLSTPITIPLLLALIVILGAMMLVVAAIVFSIVMIFIGLVVMAGSLIVAGVGVFNSAFWVAVFYIGSGVTVIGVMLMIFPAIEWLIVKMMAGIAGILKWTYYKLVRRNQVQKGALNHEKNL